MLDLIHKAGLEVEDEFSHSRSTISLCIHNDIYRDNLDNNTTHRIQGVLGAICGLLWVSELEVKVSTHVNVHIILCNSRLRFHIQGSEGEED